MILDLLRDEIGTLFPYNGRINENFYTIHCSRVFMNNLIEEFQAKAFTLHSFTVGDPPPETKFTNFQIPTIGRFKLIPDLEQGYKITKDE